MYVTTGTGRLGCSIAEMSGMHGVSVEELKQKLPKGPMTICVTTGYQKAAYKPLRDAGFVPLVKYTNKIYGHNSRCILWAAFGGKSNKPEFLPDELEDKVEKTIKKIAVKKTAAKPKKVATKGHVKVTTDRKPGKKTTKKVATKTKVEEAVGLPRVKIPRVPTWARPKKAIPRKKTAK